MPAPPIATTTPEPPPPKLEPTVTRESVERARNDKREEVRLATAKSPGWVFYETASYFIVTSVDDKDFIRELQERCESIRRVIEADLKNPRVDSTQLTAAPNVLRACKDREQFHSYGGSGGSSGYWSLDSHEIVIHDEHADGGRRNTWATLNGMVCHEYMSMQRDASPASWFAQGHADYYSGFKLDDGVYRAAPFDWRVREIQQAIASQARLSKEGKNERAYAPLNELVRFTQSEYYGNNKYKLDGGVNYAQGWSFIWFLRQAKPKSALWQPAWDHLLENWWKTWLETSDIDRTNDRAFAGIDWTALEAAWADFILRN